MEGVGREPLQTIVSNQNPELLKKAQDELNENPTRRENDIQIIRNMVSADERLTCPTDDAFLLRFLRVRKFDHDEAFKLLQQYFIYRVRYPELFVDYSPSANLTVLNQNVYVVMPQRDQQGRKILVQTISRWKPSTNADDLIRLLHMCIDDMIKEEETQVHGVVLVFNLKNCEWDQTHHFLSPFVTKKFATLFQNCLPARFKGFHHIFEPQILKLIFQVAKAFLNEKTKSRIFFHGQDLEALHKHIHPEYLPEELGGLLPPMDSSSLVHSFLEKDEEIANSVANFGYTGIPKG